MKFAGNEVVWLDPDRPRRYPEAICDSWREEHMSEKPINSEKAKMLSGILYRPGNDEALMREQFHAKTLCHAYNRLSPVEAEQRAAILGQLFGAVGDGCRIEPTLFCDYGYNIRIGNSFYSNHNLVILDPAEVIIGDNVMFGPNCGLYTAGHPLDVERRNAGLEYAFPIHIGDNVWLGGNVVVMPGVTIGENTVVGSGSVVTRDVPAGVVAVGNPCRVIRDITDADRESFTSV